MSTSCCLAFAALGFFACATVQPLPEPSSFVGRTMELEADRLDEPGELSLADLRGRIVVVDVVASWCLPCRDAIPLWAAMRDRVGPDQVEIVAVSVDESRELAADFATELAPGFPCVWDGRGDLMRAFPVSAMPTTYVLDRRGIVAHVHTGFEPSTPAVIETKVRALLARDP